MTKTLKLSAGLAALAILGAGIAAPASAFAQDAPANAAAAALDAAGDAAAVEQSGNDIIVTANRRASPLADIPIAVSAVTAQSLVNSGATDIRQLNQLAPSLLVSSSGSEANGSARIRGVGTVGDNPGLESSVAVFVDGVYRSRSGSGLNDLGEIERIEVLRGPQGTLFGRNASAGLLNIVTAAPRFTFGAKGEASYGNYDAIRLQGSVTGPISDTLAARIDGVFNKRKGFYVNVNGGDRINNRDRYLVRGQLLFEPTDALSLRLIADWSQKDEACCAAVYLNQSAVPSIGGLNDPTLNPIIRILTDLGQPAAGFTQDPYSRRSYVSTGRTYEGVTKDGGLSLEANWDLGGVKLTSITAYRTYRNNQPSDADYSQVDILYRDPYDRRFRTFTQELRLQGSAFGDRLDWLVGGYFADETLTLRDALHFGSQYGRFAACRVVRGGALAQFYDATQTGCLSATGRAVLSNQVPSAPSPFGALGTTVVAAFDRLDGIRNVGNDDLYRQRSRNYAVFTHNIFHVTDTLDITVGARYTHETKNLTATFSNNNTACLSQKAALLPYAATAGLTTLVQNLVGLACQGNNTAELSGVTATDRRSEGEWTGTAVLSWKPVDALLAYASYSRGYKAGGFNLDRSGFSIPGATLPLPLATFSSIPGGVQAIMPTLQFAPEKNTAYEVGLKLSGRGFGINIAAFRQQFSNFQLNTFNGANFLVQNINGCTSSLGGADRDTSAATGACPIGDVSYGAVSTGIEIEGSMVPAPYLRAAMGITYARTRYRQNLVGTAAGAPLDPALRLLPGNMLSNAPEYVGTASITWTPPLGNGGLSGLFYLDTRMTSDYNTGSDMFPQKGQDGYILVNGRVGIRGPGQRWAIELWGQNLFDTDYTQVGINSPFQSAGANANFPAAQFPGNTQIFSAYLGEPRTYGATVRFQF